jgi:2-C-methyl-D-erythritol 2,4-cyclodiphosphate synthase
MEKRVGIGYDSHRLVEGRKLILGGVEIPFNLGLLGHSDGDVLTHSIIDALLGASGFPDIGVLFPDSDPSYKSISSLIFLETVYKKLTNANINLINVDCVVILERPKLSPYYSKIKRSLSEVLDCVDDKINIKAKTNEGMGFIGRGEGIASIAIAMVTKP